jgi:CrcB protein
MFDIVIVALGGAIGAVLRYLLSNLILASTLFRAQNFPYPAFIINVSGSLFAGILYYFMIKNFNNFDPKLKNFLLVGFLGGYTTFSAFSLDFFRLVTANQMGLAFMYVFASVSLSILALFFGFYLMKIIFV